MKKYVFYSSIVIALLVSCGKVRPEGQIELQKKEVPTFNAIDLDGKFRTFLVQSKSNFIEIETYPNVADNLDFTVKNNTLLISEKRKTKGVDFYNITIYSQKSPQTISLSDSVEFNVSSEINTENFRLNLKNNSKFIGAIRSKNAEVNMQQTSLANFKGFTKNAVLTLKDTANIVAPYWQMNTVKMKLTNGAFAEFSVEDSLKGNVENTAKLLYHGNPVRAFKIDEKTTVENQPLD